MFDEFLELAAKRAGVLVPTEIEPGKEGVYKALLDVMNQAHFVTNEGTRIAIIRADGSLMFTDSRGLATKYAGLNTGKITLARWWLENGARREHSQVIFDPTGQRDPKAFNLWRGLGVEPSEEGSWDLFQRHMLEHISGGVQEHFDYLLRWMALGVQRLDTLPGVAIVLRGGRGVGKNTFVEAYGTLYGRHYYQADNTEAIIGKFNGHLRDKICLFANEAFWAGNKAAEGRLKSLITDPFRSIEAKGQDIIHDDANLTRLLIASNEGWVVPAGSDERRFFVLDVGVPWTTHSTTHRVFFNALHAELAAGGHARMLHDLLELKLDGFNVRDVPQTAALAEQKVDTRDPVEAWWFEKMIDGRLPGSEEEKPWPNGRQDSIFSDYSHYPHPARKSCANRTQLEMALNRLLPAPGIRSYQPGPEFGKDRARRWRLPPLDECRAFWDAKNRTTTVWPTEAAVPWYH